MRRGRKRKTDLPEGRGGQRLCLKFEAVQQGQDMKGGQEKRTSMEGMG